ncbi:uncharacterized protein LOC107271648 [Cephus cinctus]|uniref:Uncharacterized protein LOC107271648 n=1 Tax=Cephus cinctus TaxID=211228 RepID=A0AAJ7W4W9_CEPCN|nr:uncharacterized protein LOC107271648 [Cephus cinctus]
MPLLHSAAYVAATGWPTRSPESLTSLNTGGCGATSLTSLNQEWPSSPPSASSTSPASGFVSSYAHSSLSSNNTTTTASNTISSPCTLYVPSIPSGNNHENHGHCDSSGWLHSAEPLQQPYLNLNLHLHHQISSYQSLNESVAPIASNGSNTPHHEYASDYHNSGQPLVTSNHHHSELLQLQSPQTETANTSANEYQEATKEHHEISYQSQNNLEESVDVSGDAERRFTESVINHRRGHSHHFRRQDPTSPDHQTSWTSLTPPPAPQTTAT